MLQLMEETESEDRVAHLTVVTKTREFSKEDVQLLPSARFLTEIDSGRKILPHNVEVFANGNSEDNIGYVSLTVDNLCSQKNFQATCIISVVDSTGNHRFSETFTIPKRYFRKPGHMGATISVDRYISRKTLLSDPADLLPDDTLTLNFVIYTAIKVFRPTAWSPVILESFKKVYENGEREFYLLLDSPLVKHLIKESPYFERVSQTPMMERSTGRTKIGADEYQSFLSIGDYLFGAECLTFTSIVEIFDVFIVAHKYDIPIITEVCLCFLKLCLSDHDTYQIKVLGEKHLGVELWEKVDSAMREHWGAEDSGERKAKKLKKGPVTTQQIRDRVWTYKHDSNELFNLYFKIEVQKAAAKEEAFLDFYK